MEIVALSRRTFDAERKLCFCSIVDDIEESVSWVLQCSCIRQFPGRRAKIKTPLMNQRRCVSYLPGQLYSLLLLAYLSLSGMEVAP